MWGEVGWHHCGPPDQDSMIAVSETIVSVDQFPFRSVLTTCQNGPGFIASTGNRRLEQPYGNRAELPGYDATEDSSRAHFKTTFSVPPSRHRTTYTPLDIFSCYARPSSVVGTGLPTFLQILELVF
jgi:hypothetical protein